MISSVTMDLSAIWREFWPKARLLGLIGIPLVYLASGFYSVEMEQRAVLSRMGEVINPNVQPGMHYRIPWPIDSVTIIDKVELQTANVDYSKQGRSLKLQPEMVTQRGDLAEVSFEIQYSITSPSDYLYAAQDVSSLIEYLASAELINYVAQQPLEPLLTSGRSTLQQELRQRLQEELNLFGAGVKITSILLERLETPRSIRRQFDALQIAPAQKRKLEQDALAARTQALSAARIKANQYFLEQQNWATKTEQRTQGEMERFQLKVEEINQAENADYLINKEYLSTVEKIFSNAETKIVTPS